MIFDKDKAIQELNKNALNMQKISRWGMGKCARYVRTAIDVGFGIEGTLDDNTRSIFMKVGGVPLSAKSYGRNLTLLGYELVKEDVVENSKMVLKRYRIPLFKHQTCDIAVISNLDKHGHICMFNGSKWVSDFIQNDICGGPKYRAHGTKIRVYRYIG